MSNDKKESGALVKIVGAIAATIGTIVVAVLTAQNAPWWISILLKVNSKPSNLEQPTNLHQSPPTSAPPKPPTGGDDEIWNQKTLQTQTDSYIRWDLKACKRDQDNVSCFFLITSSQDMAGMYGITWKTNTNNGNTRIVGNDSSEHVPSSIQVIKNGSAGLNDGAIHFRVAQDTSYKAIVNFTDVSSSVKINLLQIDALWVGSHDTPLKFRNVPIS
ncbi:hypothetical protein [Nostoc sp.]|uniref:hypothetical protein n=1 Tax=Nostoc sp. TaxID=1180 RepID=UPI002FFA1AC8